MILEEHRKEYEISFPSVYAHMELLNSRIRGILITYCVCDFLWVPLHEERTRDVVVPAKLLNSTYS